MATYLIVDTLLDKPELYEEYKLKAKPLVEQYGGEYLARGGQLTLRETDLWSPTRMVLVRFPDADSANRFYDSAAWGRSKNTSDTTAKNSAGSCAP